MDLNSRVMKNKPILLIVFTIFLGINSFGLSAQKIGFLIDSYVMDRWYLDHKLFEDRVKKLGGECRVEVPYGDADEQVRMGKMMIDEGIDVLVLVPIDAKKAAEIVTYAKSKKVPVISYERLVFSKDISVYIGYNAEKVGQLEAEYLVKKVPQGNYILVNGPTTDNNAILLKKGQMAVLEPHIKSGKIKLMGDIVLNEWSEIESLMKVEELLSSTNLKPDAIICGNDAIANGAIQVIPKELAGKVAVAGQDADLAAIKNIIAGTQTMTIYKPIKLLAELAAETAMSIAVGNLSKGKMKFTSGDITVDAILLDPVSVDKNGIEAILVKDGHVTQSQVYGK